MFRYHGQSVQAGTLHAYKSSGKSFIACFTASSTAGDIRLWWWPVKMYRHARGLSAPASAWRDGTHQAAARHIRIGRLQNWRQSEPFNPTTFICHLTEKWADHTGFVVLTLTASRRPARIPGASSPGPLNFKQRPLIIAVKLLQFFSLHIILSVHMHRAQSAR